MNLTELKKRVCDESVKAVSFDIFDTLLLRPCLEPVDMFRLVAKRCGLSADFVTMRRKAEELARRNSPCHFDDITFEDIYNEFVESFGYSREEADKIKEAELQVELDYLTPRYSIKEVFDEAVKNGKLIVVCSDMYHSAEFLTKILNKNNYYNFKIYVSSEYKMSKGSKRLFKQVIDDLKVKKINPQEILHIGDNYRADIENSKALGMQAEYVESVKSKFKRIRFLSTLHGYMTLTSNLNSDNTFLIGYAANVIFDDPYREFDYNTRFNGELENLSNILMAPLIFTFVKWMLEDSIKRDIDKLCLIYRDGYLPEKILNILKPYYSKTPALARLRLSRRALRCFESKKKHGFIYDNISNPVNNEMTINEYLELRVFIVNELQKKEILQCIKYIGYNSLEDCIGETEKQIKLAKTIEQYFIDNSNSAIKTIEDYCREELGSFKSLGIFDIGYSGRIHKMLSDNFNIQNVCYHILGYDYLKYECKDVISFQYLSSAFTNKSMIIHNAFFEDVISEQAPSVSKIVRKDDKIEFIYDNEFIINNNIAKLQEYILKYCEGFTKTFSKDLTKMKFEGFEFYEVYKQFLHSPNKKDADIFLDFNFQDNWITGKQFSYYENWYNRKLNVNENVDGGFGTKNKKIIFLKKILRTFHLFNITKKVFLKIKNSKEKRVKLKMRESNLKNNMKNSLEAVKSLSKKGQDKKNIIFLGQIASFDKGTCKYINTISEKMSDYNFIMISETPTMTIEQIKKKIEFDILNLPVAAYPNKFDKHLKIFVTDEVKKRINDKEYLKNAVVHLNNQFVDMTESYAYNLSSYFYEYCSMLLDTLKPEKVLIWNQFSAMHEIMANICYEKKIPVIFMEFGVLPGTFSIDTKGQMGESSIAVNHNEFLNQKVSEEEILHAKQIIKYIKDVKLNRNKQPINSELDNVKDKLQVGKPTIVLFGQSDYESGLCPYTKHTKRFHSPLAMSSEESLEIINRIAEKNNYNIIYKPHPAMKYLNLKSRIKSNIIVVDEVNVHDLIDMADVVVTILSQTSYEALVRGVPVVMIGYNQLRGKGCTYEAFDEKLIESAINDAINNGFKKEQKEAFDRHVAQLLKYYLYDDLIVKGIEIGRSPEEFAKFLISYSNENNTKERCKKGE